MKKLIEIHEKVKKHDYRRNKDRYYLKEYQDLLRKFLDEFIIELKKTPYYEADGFWLFAHEFSSNASSLQYDYKDSEYEIPVSKTEVMLTIESNIGYIHRFIDSGEFKKFQTYYTGCNVGDDGKRRHTYIYNKKKGFVREKNV